MACLYIKSHVRKRLLYRNSIHAGGFSQTAWFQGVRLSSNYKTFPLFFSAGTSSVCNFGLPLLDNINQIQSGN